jgi:hypothetical protein
MLLEARLLDYRLRKPNTTGIADSNKPCLHRSLRTHIVLPRFGRCNVGPNRCSACVSSPLLAGSSLRAAQALGEACRFEWENKPVTRTRGGHSARPIGGEATLGFWPYLTVRDDPTFGSRGCDPMTSCNRQRCFPPAVIHNPRARGSGHRPRSRRPRLVSSPEAGPRRSP